MGPMATNQKFVLRATTTHIRPREPASSARDRQGSMGTGGALGFRVLGDEDAGDPDSWVSEGGGGGCAPGLLGPLSSRKGSRQAGEAAGGPALLKTRPLLSPPAQFPATHPCHTHPPFLARTDKVSPPRGPGSPHAVWWQRVTHYHRWFGLSVSASAPPTLGAIHTRGGFPEEVREKLGGSEVEVANEARV